MKRIFVLVGLVVLTNLTFAGALEDEVIVGPEERGDWEAYIVNEDEVWKKPSCVALTKTTDGLSSLEVIAHFNSSTETFGEPLVHVITPYDVSFFEVTVEADRTSDEFLMLPVAVPPNNKDEQGLIAARSLFSDRADLVQDLRQRNTVVAKYFDAEGETKRLEFSLKGSSNAIRKAFEKCELEFTELPELPGELPELD